MKIIFDKTSRNKLISIEDIDKILEILVNAKSLNSYISNIIIDDIRSNSIASYSSYTKNITISTCRIDQLANNIDSNILRVDNFEKLLYINLSIVQILLHEIEHAKQQKIAYSENSLESLILRLSFLINNGYDDMLYEFCPEERMAEINSYEEVISIYNRLNYKQNTLSEILYYEKLKRCLRGYHYKNSLINIPTKDYFALGNRPDLADVFDFSMELEKYTLYERFRYGFQITTDEYSNYMKELVLSLNNNFVNKVNIKKV